METTEAITLTILCIAVFFLLLLLVAVWRVGGSLLRIERLLGEREKVAGPANGSEKPVTAQTGDGFFNEFLASDPARAKMPKREQAEAFRIWRKERGLNWSNQ